MARSDTDLLTVGEGVWQATTIGPVGLFGGLPLGIVAGRRVWRAIAAAIGIGDDAATPVVALLLVAAGVLIVANTIAAVPARRASRTRAAAGVAQRVMVVTRADVGTGSSGEGSTPTDSPACPIVCCGAAARSMWSSERRTCAR